jgi:hypothetical protein
MHSVWKQIILDRLAPYVYEGETVYASAMGDRSYSAGAKLAAAVLLGPLAAAARKATKRTFVLGVKDSGLIAVELTMTGKEKLALIMPWADISNVVYKDGLLYDELAWTTTGMQQWKLLFLRFDKDNITFARQVVEYMAKWAGKPASAQVAASGATSQFCTQCGSQIASEDRFCRKCGRAIGWGVPST